jgi:uncharacterized Rmd1/YagE family protein
MSRAAISQRMATIFLRKTGTDLQSAALDTPSYFWDDGLQYTHVYEICIDFLDVSKRTDLLRDRLGMLTELFNILHHHLSQRHLTRLHWIVIMLLALSSTFKLLYRIIYQDIGAFLEHMS